MALPFFLLSLGFVLRTESIADRRITIDHVKQTTDNTFSFTVLINSILAVF